MKKDNEIWDKMAKSFHHLSSRSKAHRDKYKEIAKMIVDANPKNVLDLGCGSGLLEKELINQGYKGEITAIDASIEMLKIAKTICGEKVNFINADLDKKIVLDNRYDVIIAINVIFFLNGKKKFFENVRNLLSNNNPLFILVNPKPNNETSNLQFIKAHYSDSSFIEKILITINEIINLPRYYKMIKGQSAISKMADKGVIVFDNKEEISNIAKSSGFNIEKIEDIHAGQNWIFIMRIKKCY